MQLLVLSFVVIESFLLILGWAYPERCGWVLAAGAWVALLAGVDLVQLHKARMAALVCFVLALAGFGWLGWLGSASEGGRTAPEGVVMGNAVPEPVATESNQRPLYGMSAGAVVWSWLAGGALVLTLLETVVIWMGWNVSKDTMAQLKRAQSE